jgi:superfamily II DNA helicase RecQ
MADQVKNLKKKAVVMSSDTRDTIAKEFLASESTLRSASIIFCSPEASTKKKGKDTLQSEDVASRTCAIVVDEVHCDVGMLYRGGTTCVRNADSA